MNAHDWYWRGRNARGQGEPRELPDCRVTPGHRQDFYRGWDEESRMRAAVKRTPAQIAKAADLIRKLKEFTANL